MRNYTTFVTLSVFLGACQLESCAPQDVGNGIARLTVRNVGALTRLIDRDTACGFGSEAVLANPKVEGAPGTIGTATWTITTCTLSFSEPTTALKTCGEIETKVTGTATLTGTKTVRGTMTGNPKNPVIPVDADAVRFTLQASFEDFVARRPDSLSSLTINSGTLAWSAEPRLAVSASKGVCSIATSNVTFTDLTYADATVFVESNGRRFSTDVASSAYSAQVGKRGDKENWIAGELSVYGKKVHFAAAALDPDYEAAAFQKSWECVEDLKQPLDFACPSLDDKVAQGAARMTVNLFGRLADFVDEETTCGFGSAAVLARPVIAGTLGARGGSATWTLGTGCTLRFSMPTVVKTDCFGANTMLTGTVTARGTKRVTGIITGDPAQPVIPTSRDPGRADLTFEFSELRLSDSVSSTALTVQSGSLTGTIATRTGLNGELGACSIKTSVATMTQLSYRDAKLVLESDGNVFPRQVASSSLDAQSGTNHDKTNFLAGTMVIDAANVTIPTGPGGPVLDPGYDAAHFEGSYACKPKLQLVTSEEECSFTKPLAVGAARLIIQSVGTIGSLVNKDTACGFDATLVKLRPQQVVGSPGQMGSMSWRISNCELGQSAPAQVDQDCNGVPRMISGRATVDGTRTVLGLRERVLLLVDSIVPKTRQAVTVQLTSVELDELATYSLQAGASAPRARLTIHSGTLSAVVRPVLGERLSQPGTFELATPVSAITEVRLTNAQVTLESGAKTFVFTIPSAELSAFNGSYLGSTNSLAGTIQIGNTPVSLDAMPLNPDFNQMTLDSSYACTPDLKAVIPPNGP